MNKEIFKELGLTNNETNVYITLLQNNSVSVNKIASKSGLHRQAVYDALSRLLEKGFANFAITNNRKTFHAVEPENILDYLDERKRRFAAILPSLTKLRHASNEDTFVQVFRGRGVVRTIYREIRKELEKHHGEVLISGVDDKESMEMDPIALKQHLKQLRKMGCRERVLVKEGDTFFVKGTQTKYRWVPEKYFSPYSTYVFGEKLIIEILENPNYAILIHNKNLTETYRRQFNLLWKTAKKPTAFKNRSTHQRRHL